MLQIKDIKKQYKTGNFIQMALNGVSLNLRDNEFVAILGPSGSGKTTLLNIIGGLDRYDSGDLIINGITTKKYKEKDWNSYRNHTIGFVFQSYNLIPHQTILSNVELALTISGIPHAERRARAIEALEKVGLKEQIHKKPNQLSGGQMQRVAIARALVNDPDILLADEPTGALDSETSIQVMELLKEVAEDRLVVMVTHNPELAEAYATRIVRLKDGKIISDTDPYIVEEEGDLTHRNLGKASMSFLTALSLSFNNLKTKLTRTILVSFAGSIGIIGIALILSLSNGVNTYIRSIEEDTLSEYPLTIQSSSFDLSSMFVRSGVVEEESTEQPVTGEVKERQMVDRILSSTTNNDLKSLKAYLDNHQTLPTYTKAIEYSYNLAPQIYRIDGDSYRQVNPDTSFAALGFNQSSNNSLLSMAMSTDVFYLLPEERNLYENQYDVKAGRWPTGYSECVLVLMSDGGIPDLVLYALGMKDAKELDQMVEDFSNEENVTFKDSNQTYRYEDFLDRSFRLVSSSDYYTYDEEYAIWVDKTDDKRYMNDLVRKGEELKIVGVVQRKENADAAMLTTGIGYRQELIEHIIQQSLRHDITQRQMNQRTINVFTGKDFNDEESASLNMDSLFTIDESRLTNAFQFDESALQFDASQFDFSNINIGSMVSPSDFQFSTEEMQNMDILSMLSGIQVVVHQEELASVFEHLYNGYVDYSSKNPSTNYMNLPKAFQQYLQEEEGKELLRKDLQELLDKSGITDINSEDINNLVNHVMQDYPAFAQEHGYLDPEQFPTYLLEYLQSEMGQARTQEAIAQFQEKYQNISITEEDLTKIVNDLSEGYQAYAHEKQLPEPQLFEASLQEFLASEEGKKLVSTEVRRVVDLDDLQKQISKVVQENTSQYGELLANSITNLMQRVVNEVGGQIGKAMQDSMSKFATSIPNAIRFDANAFNGAFKMNMTEEDLQELMASLLSKQRDTYDGNLKRLGYADLQKPTMISIYPKDFESKEEILAILDGYNERMKLEDEEKVITYTDTVGTLMSSVTNIVDTVSYVLVAFIAISLVVSSIMIGVITYISVLERKKEIGILRAIGASKRNISQVFNAETFIIGLLAGLFGVGISRLLLIPGNMLIRHFTDANVKAVLPWQAGVVLVILSIILTLIGGIIPSRKAAKSDPVAALRTE